MLDTDRARQFMIRAMDSPEESTAVYREIENRLLERMSWSRQSPERIVDLGCGRGQASAHLAGRFPDAQVLALDHAAPMLRQLGPGVVGLCASAERIPLRSASVDTVFSNLLLPWCADPGAVIGEICRVLRPEGSLWFTSLGPDTLTELRQAWSRVDAYPHVHPFVDMHHIGDALLSAGLQNPVLEVETLTVTYPDPLALMRELKQLGAQNAHRERFRGLTGQQRMAGMMEGLESFRRDGAIPATCEVIYGHAWGAPEGLPRREQGMDVATFSVDSLRRSARR
ncbi:MAG: methyltransferase domain-containing protein [Xanthomonadales bacterium]|nr:methyltransferase domain-containing protein [Xanthomonadales bacterium]